MTALSVKQLNFYVKSFTPEKAGELVKKLGQGVMLVPTEPVHFTVKLKVGEDATTLLREIAERL